MHGRHESVISGHLVPQTGEIPVAYEPRNLTVGVLLLADYRLSTVATFVDTLQCATEQLGGDSCQSVLMSPAGRPAVSICGRSLTTESAQLWPEEFSFLAIIGDYRDRLGMPEHSIQRYIQSADRLDVPLVGIGNGVAALARFRFSRRPRGLRCRHEPARVETSVPRRHVLFGAVDHRGR